MSRISILNGRLIDPKHAIDGPHNLYIEDGRVAAIDTPLRVFQQTPKSMPADKSFAPV